MLGPIDYIVVGFNGNKFDGSILKALGDAIDKGIIRLVTLAAVIKDESGNVTAVDVADMGDEYQLGLEERYYSDAKPAEKDDIDEVSEILENNTAAGLLIVEQLWAKPLKEAILNAGGFLVAEGRIHPEAAEELSKKES